MTDQPKPSTASVFKNYNFRLLWMGQGTSLLGDQFFMIALPWLVLKLTGDPLALGIVLAMISIPRALLMLVGGAFADRYKPRAIMLASDILRLLLTILLTLMILFGWLQLWMLYLLALSFGIISSFFIPSSGAMMPLLVKPDELAISNSIYQGTTYLSSFIGPILAGGLIAIFAHIKLGESNTEMFGIATAIAVDALSFLASVITLLLMNRQGILNPQIKAPTKLLNSIKDGIAYLWRDDLLRTLFILMVATNFLFSGPMLVGIPVLANGRLAGGAAAYGIILGAYAGGNLFGILLTNKILQLMSQRMAVFMVSVIASFGIGLMLMGVVSATWVAFIIMMVIGVGNGVLAITLITFLQRQTPKDMLGRVMSLVMLASVGLVPISQALAGGLIKLSLVGVFFGAGILMLLVSIWLAVQPVLHTLHQLFTP